MATKLLLIIVVALASAVGVDAQEKSRCPEKVTYDRFEDKTTELCSGVYSRSENMKMFSLNLIIEYGGQKPRPPFKVSLTLLSGTGEYPGYPKARFDDVKSIFVLADTGRVEVPLTEYKQTDLENRHFIAEIATMTFPQDAITFLVTAKTIDARLGIEEFKFDEDALKAFQNYFKTILPPPPPKPAAPPRRRRPRSAATQPNKSFDASGGSVFGN